MESFPKETFIGQTFLLIIASIKLAVSVLGMHDFYVWDVPVDLRHNTVVRALYAHIAGPYLQPYATVGFVDRVRESGGLD